MLQEVKIPVRLPEFKLAETISESLHLCWHRGDLPVPEGKGFTACVRRLMLYGTETSAMREEVSRYICMEASMVR